MTAFNGSRVLVLALLLELGASASPLSALPPQALADFPTCVLRSTSIWLKDRKEMARIQPLLKADSRLVPLRKATLNDLPDGNSYDRTRAYAIPVSTGLYTPVVLMGHLSDGRVLVALNRDPENTAVIDPSHLWILPESPTRDSPVKIGGRSPIAVSAPQGATPDNGRYAPITANPRTAPEVSIRRGVFLARAKYAQKYVARIGDETVGHGDVKWDEKKKALEIGTIEVDDGAQGQGVSLAILNAALVDYPDATSISTKLFGTNLRVYAYYYRKGLSPEQCVMQTPMYRARVKMGFGVIDKLDFKDGVVNVRVVRGPAAAGG